MITLNIDAEFQALCPPLRDEERKLLEASLEAEGCREPLRVWRGEAPICSDCGQAIHPWPEKVRFLGEDRNYSIKHYYEAFYDISYHHEEIKDVVTAVCSNIDCVREGDIIEILDWTLLDGHNRYRYFQEHPKPYQQFEIKEVRNLPTREDAKLWILRNQLGRRNLETFQYCSLTLQYLNERMAARAKENKTKDVGRR
jgi:hypothetical protein